MKKYIAITIIITILFINISTFSYGAPEDPTNIYDNSKYVTDRDVLNEFGKDDRDSVQNEGSVDVLGEQKYISGTESSGVAMAGALTKFLTFFPWTASLLMTSVVTTGNDRTGEYSTTPDGAFSIENLVFDRYEIFNNNYFVYNSNTINYVMKSSVKNWYTGTMVIAIAGSLVTLIYMGIRAGISTVASEKAQYKRMLIDWAIGFVMIFVLHFIIIFLSNLSTQITYVLSEGIQPASLESNIMEYNMVQVSKGKNWTVVSETIIYTVIVFYQLRFFIVYMKRFFMTGFLIVIAPLMTITYALDKAADKKSQIFNTWGKELAVNIFIQPLHALLYLVFMYSAGSIAAAAPIFAIAFLMALSRGEKIVKGIFNLRGLSSIHSMGETLKLKG